MGIIINLDVMMAKRFSTLEAICRELQCQPGDILEYSKSETNPVISLGSMEKNL